MKNANDQTMNLERLDQAGTEFERWLLRSSSLDDQPDEAGEEAALEQLLAAEKQTGSRALRRVGVSASIAGVLAAAAVLALWLGSASKRAGVAGPAVSVERMAPQAAPSGSSAVRPPAEDPCAHPFKAAGKSPVIDDLEDRNARILLVEGRNGDWSSYNDLTGTQEPASGQAWHPSLIPGRRGASRYAMHTKGGVMTKWGTAATITLLVSGCYDASAYDGVTFYAKGPGHIEFFVQMSDVIPIELGGSCNGICYDSHRKAFDLERRWQRYTVMWHELTQRGFGPRLAFDPRRLRSITFGVHPADTPFDYWVDDLAFVRK